MSARWAWPATEQRVQVTGGGLTAVVAPRRGGKVVSLLDARGFDWMAPPDRPVGSPARRGDAFLAAEMAGWDECAPTIDACVVDGVSLGDHGELWTKEFAVDGHAVWVDDETLGYRFRREISAESDGLRFDYRVTARDQPVPFLWAAHPQLRAPAGSRILLPGSVTTVVDVMDPSLPERAWSAAVGSIDTIAREGYRKVYVHPDEWSSSVALVHPDGATFTMSWTAECAYLGLWFDHFAFREAPIVALEPATAYFDSLATAIKLGRCPVVDAGTTLSWSVWVRVYT